MIKRFLILCLVFAGTANSTAFGARSDWVDTDSARFRLLLVDNSDGGLTGGLEIQMDPGWHTYWKVPGDAGVPPMLDFSKSKNVASVDVQFPAPERYDDGRSISVVYNDHVVIPFQVELIDPDKPAVIDLNAFVGVCEVICIPVPLQITLDYDGEPDALSKVTLDRFLARLPSEPAKGEFDIDRIWEKDGNLMIEATVPSGAEADLFVEGPAGWTIGQPIIVENGLWSLPIAGRPENESLNGKEFHFVATSGHQAIEKTLTLAH